MTLVAIPPGAPPKPDASKLADEMDLDQLIKEMCDMADETPEQASLRADMVLIATQARSRLTLKRALYVATYLRSARDIAHNNQYIAQAKKMYDRAEVIYKSYVNARNRLRYLSGVLMGFGAMFVLLLTVSLSAKAVSRLSGTMTVLETDIVGLTLLSVFCGMGTFVSVMTRLAAMDFTEEVDVRLLWISGAARPIVSIFLAIVVYEIIRNNFIPVHLGPISDAEGSKEFQPAVGYIAAFLTGFSERFATDFIGSLPFPGLKGNDNSDRGSLQE